MGHAAALITLLLVGCRAREPLTPRTEQEFADRNTHARAKAEAAFLARGYRAVDSVAHDVALPGDVLEACGPRGSDAPAQATTTTTLAIGTATAEARWEDLCPALLGQTEKFEARVDGALRTFVIVSPDMQIAQHVTGPFVGYRLVPGSTEIHSYYAKDVACCCEMAPDGPEARLRMLRQVRVVAAEQRPVEVHLVAYPQHVAHACDPSAPQ